MIASLIPLPPPSRFPSFEILLGERNGSMEYNDRLNTEKFSQRRKRNEHPPSLIIAPILRALNLLFPSMSCPRSNGAYLFPFYPNKSAGSTCNYEQYDRPFEKRVFRNSGKRRINRDVMISRGSKRTNSRFDEKTDETGAPGGDPFWFFSTRRGSVNEKASLL